jgi:hypothetical protein
MIRRRRIPEQPELITRLAQIAEIIECVDNRCMAVDGPIPSTDEEITLPEIQKIYKIAKI